MTVVNTGINVASNLLRLPFDTQMYNRIGEAVTDSMKYSQYQNQFAPRALQTGALKTHAVAAKRGISVLGEAAGGQTFKQILTESWKTLGKIPGKAAQGWRVGGQIAAKSGKTGVSAFLTKAGTATKGLGKGLSKAMPVIGTAMMVAFELPNIVKATKDKGLLAGGAVETAKAGVKFGAGVAGAAIGQALIPIPFVGGIIGFMAGNWLATKVVGKSYSEQKVEQEQKQQQQLAQQQQMLQQIQYPPINPFQQVA